MNKLDSQDVDMPVTAEKEKSHRDALIHILGAPEKGNQEGEFRSRLLASTPSSLPTAAKSETSIRRRDRITHRLAVGLQGHSKHLCHPGTKGNPDSVGSREEIVKILVRACKSLPWSLRRSPRNHNPAEVAWGAAPRQGAAAWAEELPSLFPPCLALQMLFPTSFHSDWEGWYISGLHVCSLISSNFIYLATRRAILTDA